MKAVVISFLFLFTCCAYTANCQVKFYAVASEKRLAQGQTFQVQYIVEGASVVERFADPDFANFVVQEIFDIPRERRLDPVSKTMVESFARVAVLTSTRPGKFLIKGATAVIDGKSMNSNTLNVEVLKSGEQEPKVEEESEIKPGETIEGKIRENLFLTAQVNKTSCYVGEPLMAVYKACSRLNANSQVVKRPSLTGFSVVEMVDAYDGQPVVETVRGKPFYVHLIRKVQLFPLQAGTFQLEGAEVESIVHFYKRNSLLSSTRDLQELMDKIKSPEPPTIIPHRLTLKSAPLTITVKPLPQAGQPENFAGAVGKFSLIAKLDSESVGKGSRIRINFTVSGTGNFPLVTAPDIQWPDGLEVTEAGIEEQTNPYEYPLGGSKTFSFLLSADKSGSYTIPPATFAFFDPSIENYVEVQSSPLLAMFSDEPDTIASLPDQPSRVEPGLPKQYFWFIPIVLVIVGWIIYQAFFSGRSSSKKINPSQMPEVDVIAVPSPLVTFSAADFALARGDSKLFYESIQQVLWNTTAELCQVPPSQLNKQNIAHALRSRSVPSETISSLQQILNECEWTLYTPDTTTSDMINMKNRAETVYKQLRGIQG